ncbi:hypothetical protein Pcinc_037637 [Petrolisthes cinctipes]|uniref:Uncharacterized protein n=1 Tax=Petrolisthes cinctipes TaxID=88211 RepID=A0AAE1BS10_PETCI|nr:hypothetical protein Pcinc_037637 [Petrolisthes cinctipes]
MERKSRFSVMESTRRERDRWRDRVVRKVQQCNGRDELNDGEGVVMCWTRGVARRTEEMTGGGGGAIILLSVFLKVGVMGVRVMDVDDKRRPPPTSVTGEGRGEERGGGKEG